MRDDYTSKYGFPIVTDQAIQWIAEQTNNTPMIEIGAGNGYLSKEMQERGIDVIATDPSELDQNDYRLGRIEHVPIEKTGRHAGHSKNTLNTAPSGRGPNLSTTSKTRCNNSPESIWFTSENTVKDAPDLSKICTSP